jgi:hypothetical protein
MAPTSPAKLQRWRASVDRRTTSRGLLTQCLRRLPFLWHRGARQSDSLMPRKSKKANGHGGAQATAKVAFDYIKSQHFRVIRADGAIGAVTPNGMIHMALFSERLAIPRRLVHGLASDGTLGPPIDAETISRGSVVREMDVDIFLRPDVAESLCVWLTEKIQEARAAADKARRGGKK